MPTRMTRIERIWGWIEDAIMGVFAGAALLLICYEVVARYFVAQFPQFLPDWGAEVTIYLTVWAVLIAGSQLVQTGRHIRADLVVRQLPDRAQWLLELINLLAGLFYCGIVAWFGWQVVEFAQMLDERSESSLQFRMWIFYIILPISFGLMCLRYLIRLYRYLFHFSRSMLFVDDHGDGGTQDRIERSQT